MIDDINYAFEYFRERDELFNKHINKRNALNKTLFWLIGIVLYFKFHKVLYKLSSKPKIRDKQLVFFVFTKNQQIVYEQIAQMIGDEHTLITNLKGVRDCKNSLYFSNKRLLLYALSSKHIREVYHELSRNPWYEKHTYKIIQILGLDYILRNRLGAEHVVVNLNDHSPLNVYLEIVSKRLKFTTTYIQHAPVSEKFPPLFHDHNILFSEISKQYYKFKRTDIKTYVACDIRLLGKAKGIDNGIITSKSVLICSNLLDDIDTTVSLFKELIKIGYHVGIRLHPRDERRGWEEDVQVKNHLRLGTTIWDDLYFHKIVITNESAVPLEAILNENLLYKASFLSKDNLVSDNYGFIKEGLITKDFHEINTLVKSIGLLEKTYNRDRLQKFVGNIDEAEVKYKAIFDEISKKNR